MDERRDGGGLFNWPSLLVLAAAAGGLFWLQAPLRSSRPTGQAGYERTALGDQVVEARLWQDPFDAAATHRKAAESSGRSPQTEVVPTPHTLDEVASQIVRRLTNSAAPPTNVTVLLQMVSSGPYAEDSETRLRARNAVVSALGAAGFAPWDEEHIDYFDLHWAKGRVFEAASPGAVSPLKAMTNQPGATLTVPFEWFQPSDLPLSKLGSQAATSHALVCWLPREAFDDFPLKRLAQLVAALREAVTNQAVEVKADRLHFQLFDPGLRGALQEAAAALKDAGAGESRSNGMSVTNVLRGVEVYSSWSTAADALLLDGATFCRREAASNEFARCGMPFFNVTATDNELAGRLIEELDLRGVDLSGNRASVALISEWDTFYGRALPLTFAAELIRRKKGTNFSSALGLLKSNQVPFPSNVLHFTYLRGVDGRWPGAPPAKEKNGQDITDRQKFAQMERPEGPSQLDYVPRLAGELLERDYELGRERAPPLKAIGVLGSDVYDKLLLLQALRDRFPSAVFFTTDLDARLSHPDELAWSRNLVVASSFDLELEELLQDPIPPFRDSYQTGRFLACLVALGALSPTNLCLIEPRLFEIGRSGPYVLDTEGNRLYSERPFVVRGRALLWTILAVLLAGALAFQLSPPLRRLLPHRRSYPDSERCLRRSLLIAFSVAGLVLAGLMANDHFQPHGEPFSFGEGISLWPTEILRWLAAALSAGFVVNALCALQRSRKEMAREYCLANHAGEDGDRKGIWSRWKRRREFRWQIDKCRIQRGALSRRWLKSLMLLWAWVWQYGRFRVWISIFRWDWGKHKTVNAVLLWRQYERLADTRIRLWRCVPAALLYLVFGFCLVLALGEPFRPYRGWVSGLVDQVALMVSVAFLVFLNFFVVDAVRLCRAFVTNLSHGPTLWPPELLQRHAVQRNTDAAYLAGWLDMKFIAEYTSRVGQFIYYPFIVLFIMMVARHSSIDRWNWPASLILMFGLMIFYAVYCAVVLHLAAEKARRRELDQLRESLAYAQGLAQEHEPKNQPDQIRLMIEEIESLREGVFASASQQPFIRAILLTLGGVGGLPLIQHLPSWLDVLF